LEGVAPKFTLFFCRLLHCVAVLGFVSNRLSNAFFIYYFFAFSGVLRYASEDLRPHVPYLTAEPETSCRRLDPSRDALVLLASDGLWEVAEPQHACAWAATHLGKHGLPSSCLPSSSPTSQPVDNGESAAAGAAAGDGATGREPSAAAPQALTAAGRPLRNSGGGSGAGFGCNGRSSSSSSSSSGSKSSSGGAGVSVSQEVVVQALAACAAKQRTSALELGRLPPGPERRKFHDDVTVVVVLLPAAQRLAAGSNNGVEPALAAAAAAHIGSGFQGQ
jgi:hypothetical protein